MRLVERDDDEFVEDHFPDRVSVRKFKDCQVWLAGSSPLLLIVADGLTRRAAIYEYDTAEERERAAERVRRMPEDEGGAGSPAFTGPRAPRPVETSFEERIPEH